MALECRVHTLVLWRWAILVVKGKIIIFLLFLKDFPNYKTIVQEMGYIKIEFMDMSKMDCPLKVDCKKNRSQQEMRSFERHKSV